MDSPPSLLPDLGHHPLLLQSGREEERLQALLRDGPIPQVRLGQPHRHVLPGLPLHFAHPLIELLRAQARRRDALRNHGAAWDVLRGHHRVVLVLSGLDDGVVGSSGARRGGVV